MSGMSYGTLFHEYDDLQRGKKIKWRIYFKNIAIMYTSVTKRGKPAYYSQTRLIFTGQLAAQLACLGRWVLRRGQALAGFQPIRQTDGTGAFLNDDGSRFIKQYNLRPVVIYRAKYRGWVWLTFYKGRSSPRNRKIQTSWVPEKQYDYNEFRKIKTTIIIEFQRNKWL